MARGWTPFARSVALTAAAAGLVVAFLLADTWGVLPDSWSVPLLIIGLPVVLLFNLAVYRWGKQRKRAAAGLCGTCGYDLRASPGRCPECGALHDGQQPPHNQPLERTGRER
jgi:hypothetical protein